MPYSNSGTSSEDWPMQWPDTAVITSTTPSSRRIPMISISKLKQRVRSKELSPMEALDLLNLAEREGQEVRPSLWKWIRSRMRRAQLKYGTHGHLLRR